MNLTVAFVTNRIDPHFDWFFDSLNRQKFDGPIIVVDFLKEAREKPFTDPRITHVTPKPCVWQGDHKLTKGEYFAAANSRNTAFAICETSHIAFVDDLSVIMPGWLDQVRHACQNNYVMAGAYKKLWEMKVTEGELTSYLEKPSGIDSRWGRGSDDGIRTIEGGCLFGCNFCLPMQAAIDVNGQDEVYDSLGGEDWDFGMRLERAGYKIMYNRNARTYESEEGHADSNFTVMQRRIDKRMGDTYSSNVLLNRLLSHNNYWTLGNVYPLAKLREIWRTTKAFPVPESPTHHWPDGQPLSEM